jgi:hypothetical protein
MCDVTMVIAMESSNPLALGYELTHKVDSDLDPDPGVV